MKAALNGGLNLSVLDGWWAEGYDGTNGWAIDGDVDAGHRGAGRAPRRGAARAARARDRPALLRPRRRRHPPRLAADGPGVDPHRRPATSAPSACSPTTCRRPIARGPGRATCHNRTARETPEAPHILLESHTCSPRARGGTPVGRSEIRTEIEIAAPPATVWAVLADFAGARALGPEPHGRGGRGRGAERWAGRASATGRAWASSEFAVRITRADPGARAPLGGPAARHPRRALLPPRAEREPAPSSCTARSSPALWPACSASRSGGRSPSSSASTARSATRRSGRSRPRGLGRRARSTMASPRRRQLRSPFEEAVRARCLPRCSMFRGLIESVFLLAVGTLEVLVRTDWCAAGAASS